MGESNPAKDKMLITIIASVAVVAIVAISFGFMSYGKKTGSSFGIANDADLSGQAAMPLAIEEVSDAELISDYNDEEPPLDSESEQPTADFPGVDAPEANVENG